MVNVTPVEPATDSDDWMATVTRVVDEATAADGRSPLNEEAMLRLGKHGLSGLTLWLADGDGYAVLAGSQLDVAVRPESREQGVGTALVEAAVAGNHETLTAWSHGGHPAAARLAAQHGFEPTRELWLMRRAPAPVEVSAPAEGTELRTFRPGDEQAVLAVNAAAFAHHPEQGDLSPADLKARMEQSWWDPAGLFLAVRGDEVLGFHWTKVHADGAGEVYVVGIAPQAQGLGLGRALVSTGLDHLQPREVILYVEADNLPAVRLYESLGFTHAARDTDVQYTRTVTS